MDAGELPGEKANVGTEEKAEGAEMDLSTEEEAVKEASVGPQKVKLTVMERRGLRFQHRMRFQPENVNFSKETPHHEYYKNLLDTESQDKLDIPRAICVADKVESSAKEMKAMISAIGHINSGRGILQQIPRHMRRRAASHNRRRLPRRLHAQAERDTKKRNPQNRKKRRRKRDLQNEFQKRAGKHGWLETHMWHAKRFHMSESNDPKYAKWGNRVALYPNDKSFRACYRAVAKHCLIQDISYLRCLQLCGSKKDLLNLFEEICGNEFDDQVCSGEREAELVIFKPSSNNQLVLGTKECIGPASLLWQPKSEEMTGSVLLWLHPTILSNAMKAIEIFKELKSLDINVKDVSDNFVRFRLTGPKSSVTLLSILQPLNIHPSNAEDNEKTTLCQWMANNEDIVRRLHKDFITVATDCHRQIFARTDNEHKDVTSSESFDGDVFPIVTNDPRLTLPLDKTTPTLTKSKETLTEHMVIEESEMPSVKSGDDGKTSELDLCCCSPLWDEIVVNEVAGSRRPDHIVSTRKLKQKLEISEQQKEAWRKSLMTAVPIIAIRKVQNENRDLGLIHSRDEKVKQTCPHSGPDANFASGWDLILPKNWGTAFWIPLIYHRARAGALRENKNINLECLRPHFPQDFPDTIAGEEYWKAEGDKIATKHYKRPPAKRTNYSVLAVPSPFRPDWKDLLTSENQQRKRKTSHELSSDSKRVKKEPEIETKVEESSCPIKKESPDPMSVMESSSSAIVKIPESINMDDIKVSVMRKEDVLLQLKDWILNVLKLPTSSPDKSAVRANLPSPFSSMANQLICVSVKALSKGNPLSRSMICLPSTHDLDMLCDELMDPYKYGLKSVMGPSEQKHKDPDRKERKKARTLARKRKKCKNSKETVITSEKMETTELPQASDVTLSTNKPQSFPVRPSREIIGYVTSGDFLFTYACGAGVGFVTLKSLLLLVKMQAEHVKMRKLLNDEFHRTALLDAASRPLLLALMRTTDSVQYRFVKLEVIKPF